MTFAERYGLEIAIGVGIAALLALIVWAAQSSVDRCHARGGHIVSLGSNGVGISSSGKVVTTYNATTICVSADGRILE